MDSLKGWLSPFYQPAKGAAPAWFEARYNRISPTDTEMQETGVVPLGMAPVSRILSASSYRSRNRDRRICFAETAAHFMQDHVRYYSLLVSQYPDRSDPTRRMRLVSRSRLISRATVRTDQPVSCASRCWVMLGLAWMACGMPAAPSSMPRAVLLA